MAFSTSYLKYPFSVEARESSQRLARDVRELIRVLSDPVNDDVVEAAEARVYAALTREDIKVVSTGDERGTLVYPASRLIVEAIGNQRLKEYQAEAESKAVNAHLGKEKDSFLINLAKKSFEWNVRSMGDLRERAKLPFAIRSFELRISFENFLEIAPTFHASEWKLTNRYIENGWVLVRKSELCRLMSGKFKQLILDSSLRVPKLPERLTQSVMRIEEELGTKLKSTEPIRIEGQITSAFPPCIQMIHNDSLKGKNLSHDARFALASFLLKIGMSDDDVLKAFATAPDFIRGLAEYQVRHIASKAGGEGYTPPGCRKMQGNGLCPVYLRAVWDPLCEYVSHPLAFYNTRAWEITNNVTDHGWYVKKMRKKQNL